MLKREARRAGIIPHSFAYENALKLGFVCASASLFGDVAPLQAITNIEKQLSSLDLKESDLILNDKSELDAIKGNLGAHGEEVPKWFAAGFWCCSLTSLLVDTAIRNKASGRWPIDILEARHLLSEKSLKNVSKNFLNALIDIGVRPNEAEDYAANNVMPFLWESSLQKWAHDIDMAVMHDLSFDAREQDKDLRDFPRRRSTEIIKALIKGIPFVGEAIAVSIFGQRD